MNVEGVVHPSTGEPITFQNSLINGQLEDDEDWFDALDFGKAWVDAGPSPAGNPGPYLHVPYAGTDKFWTGTVHRVYRKPDDWKPVE